MTTWPRNRRRASIPGGSPRAWIRLVSYVAMVPILLMLIRLTEDRRPRPGPSCYLGLSVSFMVGRCRRLLHCPVRARKLACLGRRLSIMHRFVVLVVLT